MAFKSDEYLQRLRNAGIIQANPPSLTIHHLHMGTTSQTPGPRPAYISEWMTASNAIAFQNQPWAHLSAPHMQNVDVQKNVSSFLGFSHELRKNKNFGFYMFDLESTTSDLNSDVFHITEVAFNKYKSVKGAGLRAIDPTGSLNLLIAPSEQKVALLNSLIGQAERHEALSPAHRYAVAGLLRYADGAAFGQGTIASHSSLWDPVLATGNRSFEASHIAGMRQGLQNLIANGVSEDVARTKIAGLAPGTIIGHNIDNFDNPALHAFMRPWEQTMGRSSWTSKTRTIDNYALAAMMTSDSSKLYGNMIYFDELQNALEKMSYHTATKEARRETVNRLAKLNIGGVGSLREEALMNVLGIAGTQTHVAVQDAADLGQVFSKEFGFFSRMLKIQRTDHAIDRMGVPRSLNYGTGGRIAAGDTLISYQALRATGLDFAVDDAIEAAGGAVTYPWVINRKAAYTFEGLFFDPTKDNGTFFARLRSNELGRTAFLSGKTEDEVRRKLQSGVLQKVNDPGSLGREGLLDLGRRRIDRWGSLEGGFSSFDRFMEAWNTQNLSGISNYTEARDIMAMSERLGSEAPYLNMFRGMAKSASGMDERELTLAFRGFYNRLQNDIFESAIEPVAEDWAGSVPILGSNIGLANPDQFASRFSGAINRRIPMHSTAASKEASRNALFSTALSDLAEGGYISSNQAKLIQGSTETIQYKALRLREILLNSEQVLEEAKNLTKVGMGARTVKAALVGQDVNEMVRGIAREELGRWKGISRLDKATIMASGLLENNPYRERIFDALATIEQGFSKAGMATHFVSRNGKLAIVAHANDRSTTQRVISALLEGQTPDNVISFYMPTIDAAGNISFGRQSKLFNMGRLSKTRYGTMEIIDPYTDLVNSITRRASFASRYVAQGNIQAANGTISRGINNEIASLSGMSRSSMADARDFSASVLGNDYDILRRSSLNVIDQKAWDSMSVDKKGRWLVDVKKNLLAMYPDEADFINGLTLEGVKDTQFRAGLMNTLSARGFSPFGDINDTKRPNIIQRLNYYAYNTSDINSKIEGLGSPLGLSSNPYIIGKAEVESYKTLGRPGGLSKGVTVGTIDLSTQELGQILRGERAQALYKKYGFSSDEVNEIIKNATTYNHSGVLDPMFREVDLLTAAQPKHYAVSIDDIKAGKVKIGEDVLRWKERGGGPLEMNPNTILYQEFANTKKPLDKTFGEMGVLHNVYEEDGMIHFDADAHYAMSEGVKVFHGQDKTTNSFFGVRSRPQESSALMHELLGADVFAIRYNNVRKYMTTGDDIAAAIRMAMAVTSTDPSKRQRLLDGLRNIFGDLGFTTLDGRIDETLVDPFVRGTDIDAVSKGMRQLMSDLNIRYKRTIDGVHTSVGYTEMRRSNVNESFYQTDYLGRGIEEGHGMKITPREVVSLKYKGLTSGAESEMDTVLRYIATEGVNPGNNAGYNIAANDTAEMIRLIGNPKELDKKTGKYYGEFGDIPRDLDKNSHIARMQLSGTMLAQDQMQIINFPGNYTYKYNPAEFGMNDYATAAIHKLPIIRPAIVGGQEVYLNEQAQNISKLRGVFEAWESFNNKEANHFGYDSREDVEAHADKIITEYIGEGYKNITSSHSEMYKHVLTKQMPTSGYMKAKFLPHEVNLVAKEQYDGVAEISKGMAEHMFGSEADSPEVWDRLTSEEGFYSFVRRDPNETSWNINAVRLKVNPNWEGKTLAISAVDAAKMEADFDGDQLSLLSPYSQRVKNMGSAEFDRLQTALKGIHSRQMSQAQRITDVLRREYNAQPGERVHDPLDFMGYVREKMTDSATDVEQIYHNQLAIMEQRMGSASAGRLYNVAHRYREAGLAIYEGLRANGQITDSQMRRRLSSLEMFTWTATERFSLKSKQQGFSPEMISRAISTLESGQGLESLTEDFAGATTDVMVAGWEGASDALHAVGANSFADATAEQMTKMKTFMAQDVLGTVSETIRTAQMSGYGSHFEKGSIGGGLMFSEQLANAGNLSAMAQYLEGGTKYIPTETHRMVLEALGRGGEYEAELGRFKQALNPTRAVLETGMNAVAGEGGEMLQEIAATLNKAEETTGMWKKLPAVAAIGAGLGLGFAAIGSITRKEPSPGKTPKEKPYDGPTARISTVTPQEIAEGQNIKVRARNANNTPMEQIGAGVSGAAGRTFNQANINLNQRDDTSTINHEWMQDALTNAIRYGRVPSSKGGSY